MGWLWSGFADGSPADVVPTVLVGDFRFVGAVTAGHDEPRRLADHLFARSVPTRRLRFGPGLFGCTPWPVGPVNRRHGSDDPRSADRFAPRP